MQFTWWKHAQKHPHVNLTYPLKKKWNIDIRIFWIYWALSRLSNLWNYSHQCKHRKAVTNRISVPKKTSQPHTIYLKGKHKNRFTRNIEIKITNSNFFELYSWNSAPSKMPPYCFRKIIRHWETNLGNSVITLFTSWTSIFYEATFREIPFLSLGDDGWIYLSKRSLIKLVRDVINLL